MCEYIVLYPGCYRFSTKFTYIHIAELVTSDIVSLSSNIPHVLGENAIKCSWKNGDKKLTVDFSKISSAIILKRNVFYPNGMFHKQMQRTDMGTKMIPYCPRIFISKNGTKLWNRLWRIFTWTFLGDIKYQCEGILCSLKLVVSIGTSSMQLPF